jgi:hypothetical protein
MVVLWSKAASDSLWVRQECCYFDTKRYKGKQRVRGHEMIHVLLDGTDFIYKNDQAVTEIHDKGFYTAGPSTVTAASRQAIIGSIARGLRESSLPVARAIITATRKCLTRENVRPQDLHRCVDFDYVPPAGHSLNELLGQMKISNEQLISCYGEQREDWHPFGDGSKTILEVLENVRQQLNRVKNAIPIRWEPVEDRLFSNDQSKIESAVDKLANGLSLVVIDPVALYSTWIRDLIQSLDRCFANPQAIIVVLPMFPTPPQPKAHSDMIKQVFKRLVDYFYEELPELEHAQCCIFTADDADIRRLVRATLRQRGADELVKAASPFLTGRIQ